jgi:hypothetical protein
MMIERFPVRSTTAPLTASQRKFGVPPEQIVAAAKE